MFLMSVDHFRCTTKDITFEDFESLLVATSFNDDEKPVIVFDYLSRIRFDNIDQFIKLEKYGFQIIFTSISNQTMQEIIEMKVWVTYRKISVSLLCYCEEKDITKDLMQYIRATADVCN